MERCISEWSNWLKTAAERRNDVDDQWDPDERPNTGLARMVSFVVVALLVITSAICFVASVSWLFKLFNSTGIPQSSVELFKLFAELVIQRRFSRRLCGRFCG